MITKKSPPITLSHLTAEPYRIFFPLALLAGILGVMLWPAYYWKWTTIYPIQLHARLMIEGFVGGFALGFLTTALPKMLTTPSLHPTQLFALLTTYLAAIAALLTGKQNIADAAFAISLTLLVIFIGIRVIRRKDLPPHGMILAALGILSGIAGATYWALYPNIGLENHAYFAQRLLYQAFILLPILGVGSFIFPMIFSKNKPELPTKVWILKALECLVVGFLIITTYWIETHGNPTQAPWIRFAICAIWITKECGWIAPKRSTGIMATSLQIGILFLLSSLIIIGIIDGHRIALEHILYIGGFGTITLIVATRVIFGHSGQSKQFKTWNKLIITSIALLILTMATRVSADFIPGSREDHHIYAAFCWLTVSIIWAIAVIPYIKKLPPQNPTIKKSPPKNSPNLLDINLRK